MLLEAARQAAFAPVRQPAHLPRTAADVLALLHQLAVRRTPCFRAGLHAGSAVTPPHRHVDCGGARCSADHGGSGPDHLGCGGSGASEWRRGGLDIKSGRFAPRGLRVRHGGDAPTTTPDVLGGGRRNVPGCCANCVSEKNSPGVKRACMHGACIIPRLAESASGAPRTAIAVPYASRTVCDITCCSAMRLHGFCF